MPRLLLLIVAVFTLWYLWQYLRSSPAKDRKRLLWKWGSLALLAIAVILVATGRIHWVGAALAAMIPLLRSAMIWLPRVLPVATLLGKKFGPSTLRTQGLKVTFDFASGDADGEVFTGPFTGKQLSELDDAQLKEQLAFFQADDRQSTLLLQAYLMKKGIGGFSQSGQNGNQNNSPMDTNLSQEEALQILGLEPGADKEEIVKAHKRLIQKLHPDRGGNQYLAAKINAARDRLVG